MRKKLLQLLPATALLLQTMPAEAVGTGQYSHDINWANSGNLYYYVTGGPPSTCGDLWVYRNSGPWVETAGWLCTDSSGNATKGPWTWAGQVGDETAYSYIEWPVPYGTTNIDSHIWDKTCATTTIGVSGSPPASFSGSATDVAWGAGFSGAWTQCLIDYRNTTTGKYWDPATGSYSSNTPPVIGCTVSGMPSMSVTWAATQRPGSGSPPHVSGNCYSWTVYVTDGYCSYPDSHNFCYP